MVVLVFGNKKRLLMTEEKEPEKYTLNEFINEANGKLEDLYQKPVDTNGKYLSTTLSKNIRKKWRNKFYLHYGNDVGDRLHLDHFIKHPNFMSYFDNSGKFIKPYIKLIKADEKTLKETMKNEIEWAKKYSFEGIPDIYQIRNVISTLNTDTKDRIVKDCRNNIERVDKINTEIYNKIKGLNNKFQFIRVFPKDISSLYSNLKSYNISYLKNYFNCDTVVCLQSVIESLSIKGHLNINSPESIHIIPYRKPYLILSSKNLYNTFRDMGELLHWKELMLSFIYFIKKYENPELNGDQLEIIDIWDKKDIDYWLITDKFPKNKNIKLIGGGGQDPVEAEMVNKIEEIFDRYEQPESGEYGTHVLRTIFQEIANKDKFNKKKYSATFLDKINKNFNSNIKRRVIKGKNGLFNFKGKSDPEKDKEYRKMLKEYPILTGYDKSKYPQDLKNEL